MKKKHSGITISLTIICAVWLFSYIGNASSKLCIKSGCYNKQDLGSSYCYTHKPRSSYTERSYSDYKSKTKSGTSTKSNYSSKSSGNINSSSYTKSTGSSSKTYSNKNSYLSKSSTSRYYGGGLDSYDDGYEDIYENDDYDWDRYDSDFDYADGVDDAMDELDW